MKKQSYRANSLPSFTAGGFSGNISLRESLIQSHSYPNSLVAIKSALP